MVAAGSVAALFPARMWLGDAGASVLAFAMIGYGGFIGLRSVAMDIQRFEADQRPDLQ